MFQVTAYYLNSERRKNFLDPLDKAVSLIAAATHDIDHPGR